MSKSTSEENNISIGIKNSLIRNSKFMYYDNMNYKPSNDVKETREESIEFKVAIGTYFTKEDFFILKEVHNLGITNVATLMKRIAMEMRSNPKKSYPVPDYQSLKARMQYLVRQGVLISYEFTDTYNRSMFVFMCNMYGWRLFKNKLQAANIYDKNMVFKAETEIFKRLASNSVAYAFVNSLSCTSILINETIKYDTRKRGFAYGYVTLDTENGKAAYIIEPVYFNVDNRLISNEENEDIICSRLSQMEELITSLNDENPTKLIIVVENYEGLTKTLKLIKEMDMEFYINYCYFTSENVIFDSKDELRISFLQISLREDKYYFKVVQDENF